MPRQWVVIFARNRGMAERWLLHTPGAFAKGKRAKTMQKEKKLQALKCDPPTRGKVVASLYGIFVGSFIISSSSSKILAKVPAIENMSRTFTNRKK
ncbi:9759_t:CDS:2 [Acaulospora colombiana]|uniref:9759_t:CDS:1 n=1 Tax=Acaulospora colombiana TaxID=27376 RepID=A0ACA9KLB4_9GLOM|nr:9759_t:CDS:2 [Acaulospora colombiana]